MEWTFQDARERFEELIEHALTDGPQRLIFDGDELEIEIRIVEREKWRSARSLKEMILYGPDLSGLDLSRDQSPMREFDWE
jgi:hypothetical protein